MSDVAIASSSRGVPKNTISPPRSPAPGPMSRMRSASSMICGSCSTTTSELPASRRRFITPITRPHVARVQADRRLVEHEQRVHERRAERGGQVDALHLAAGQRARLAVEREVAQAHFAEIAEARRGSRRAADRWLRRAAAAARSVRRTRTRARSAAASGRARQAGQRAQHVIAHCTPVA